MSKTYVNLTVITLITLITVVLLVSTGALILYAIIGFFLGDIFAGLPSPREKPSRIIALAEQLVLPERATG